VSPTLGQRALAETLGTALLLATVIGSGIMAERLSGGNVALALLCNALATGAILPVLILIFGPVSGAHINPAVSIAFAIEGTIGSRIAVLYITCQIAGGIAGAWIAHAMFELPILQISATVRSGYGQWLAEAVAAFGLVLAIFGCVARAPAATPYAVGLYITAAYWFTASTSFANPAVTIARALSNTFAGIAPSGVPAFVAAQLLGMFAAIAAGRLLWRARGHDHPEKSRYALPNTREDGT
jgi:glycerol uptake facilitator-like aquaporin